MPTIDLNGIDIYYERSGAGPRLLFLNGSGSSIATSELLIQLFTNDFDVLVHDQRGLGLTSVPPGPYSMAGYAADAAALLDHVGWDRTRVIGVSFGGMVAQELAVTWPERVERLASCARRPVARAVRRIPSTSSRRCPRRSGTASASRSSTLASRPSGSPRTRATAVWRR